MYVAHGATVLPIVGAADRGIVGLCLLGDQVVQVPLWRIDGALAGEIEINGVLLFDIHNVDLPQ